MSQFFVVAVCIFLVELVGFVRHMDIISASNTINNNIIKILLCARYHTMYFSSFSSFNNLRGKQLFP